MKHPAVIRLLRPCLGLLAIWLAAGPAPCRAQSAGDAALSTGSGRLLGLRLPFSAFAASSDGAGQRYALTLKPADHGRLTTAIEYRMTPRGPVGSLGLQTARDGPDIPPYEVNNAAALGPRGAEARIGARISYHF